VFQLLDVFAGAEHDMRDTMGYLHALIWYDSIAPESRERLRSLILVWRVLDNAWGQDRRPPVVGVIAP
jgi:hypothetical protein